jgi:hypothetical protein
MAFSPEVLIPSSMIALMHEQKRLFAYPFEPCVAEIRKKRTGVKALVRAHRTGPPLRENTSE